MSNTGIFPVNKFQITFPMWVVDNLEHTTDEEMGKKVHEFLKSRMINEPDSLLKYADIELCEDSGVGDMSEDEIEDKVRFSKDYIIFLSSMMEAGLMDKLTDKGEEE